MESGVDLSIAIEIIERKIANLNMKIVENNASSALKEELDELLNMKKEIYKGNKLLINKIVNNEKESNDWFKREN